MILKLFAYLFAAIGLCVALFAGYQYMDLRSLAFAGAGQQMTDNKFLLAMLERAAGVDGGAEPGRSQALP